MINVKLSTPAPNWPWNRQLPLQGNDWGPFSFSIDRSIDICDAWVVFETLDRDTSVICPPDRTVFVTGEPSSIGHYHPAFLRQFSLVVSCNPALKHPNVLRMQQGHPWFVERTLDELTSMKPMEKSEELCVIVSDKDFTPGHERRLRFVRELQKHFGERLAVFGRGIRDFESKWDLLSRYRYTIVLENSEEDDFLTEKLPDAWLAFCFPFYAGAPNVERYFPAGSYIELNLDSPADSVASIESVLSDQTHYSRELDGVIKVRQYYLQYCQFFPNISIILQWVIARSTAAARRITLTPNSHNGSVGANVYASLCALGSKKLCRRVNFTADP